MTLTNNLKAIKRSAKDSGELLRVVSGVLTRRFSTPRHDSDPVGTVTKFSPRPYRPGQTLRPVNVVTPENGHYLTTFFDVDALSPSGRYLAVTRVPFIWRIPYLNDSADVCVIDLQQWTCKLVYKTKGWGSQLGANVQWGSSDDTLFCNDVVNGKPAGIRLALDTLAATVLEGPIYGLSPDARYSYSADIELINAGIPGYGVPEGLLRKRRATEGASATEGVWRTDLQTGKRDLFLSLADIVAALPADEQLQGGLHYAFNIKVNRQNTRLMILIFTRGAPGRAGWPAQVVTCDVDGSNIRLAMPDRLYRHGGHHPNWTSDGDHIVMNLKARGKPMAFVRFNYDGTGLETLAPGHKGSGHPSLNPARTTLMTDAYIKDGFTDARGEVPIRLVDLAGTGEVELARVFTNKINGPRRVDPHPVWSRDGKLVCFNGVINGHRQVLLADMDKDI